MRDQEKWPKLLTSRRRGGLFKYQNKFFLNLERHHLGGALLLLAFETVASSLLPEPVHTL